MTIRYSGYPDKLRRALLKLSGRLDRLEAAGGGTSDSAGRYSEFTYDGDLLARVDSWDSPAKTTYLEEKRFIYQGEQLYQVQTTQDGLSQTKTLEYSGGTVTVITVRAS